MLRVTQSAVEVIRKPSTAKTRVTACAAEVLCRPATRFARTTQLALEVLRANVAPPSSGTQQPLIIVVAG